MCNKWIFIVCDIKKIIAADSLTRTVSRINEVPIINGMYIL